MLSRIFEEDVQKRKNASSQEPPSKRVKIYTNNEDIDDDEYEEALRKLKEYGKHQKGSNHKDIKHLMELTKLRHHAWIRENWPLIEEVIEKYPCLATSKWVRSDGAKFIIINHAYTNYVRYLSVL